MKFSSRFWDPNVENDIKYLNNNKSSMKRELGSFRWKVLAVDTIVGVEGPFASAVASSCSAVM